MLVWLMQSLGKTRPECYCGIPPTSSTRQYQLRSSFHTKSYGKVTKKGEKSYRQGCYRLVVSPKFSAFSQDADHIDVVLAMSLSALTFVILLTAAVVLGKKKLVTKQRGKNWRNKEAPINKNRSTKIHKHPC